MEEVESTPGEDTPPSAAETPAPETVVAPAPAANFDHLRGFQAMSPETPPADAENYAVELGKELATDLLPFVNGTRTSAELPASSGGLFDYIQSLR